MPISPELYKKHKTIILEYSNAIHDSRQRGLTAAEIAEKIGLTEWEVREILSVAEKDLPMKWWSEADEFKKRNTLKSLGKVGGRGLGKARARARKRHLTQHTDQENDK